jgi:hypothetical protein
MSWVPMGTEMKTDRSNEEKLQLFWPTDSLRELNLVLSNEMIRNPEWFCWRGPAAIYCPIKDVNDGESVWMKRCGYMYLSAPPLVISSRGVLTWSSQCPTIIEKVPCKIWGFHSGSYEEYFLLGYKNPASTSHETHYFSVTEPSRLILCKVWGFHGGDYEECRSYKSHTASYLRIRDSEKDAPF